MDELKISFPSPCPERWDAMSSEGRNRHCAQCSKTIHDLSRHTLREVDSLLRSGEEVCARGLIDMHGRVVMKPRRRVRLWRVLTSALASVALLFSPALVLAGSKAPTGKIKGGVDYADDSMRVTATAPDGRTFTAKTNSENRFTFKKLPPGDYAISFNDGRDKWDYGTVTVTAGKSVKLFSSNPHVEEIVGVMSRRRW
jgi:hypothetical protein